MNEDSIQFPSAGSNFEDFLQSDSGKMDRGR